MFRMNNEKLKFNIFIPLKPFGKQRPVIVNKNAFTPKKTLYYEKYIKNLFFLLYGNRKKILGSFKITINSFFVIPKTQKKGVCLGDFFDKKPDIDNICKIVLDALNGLAYEDDAKCVGLVAEKKYGDSEGVSVCIEEV